MIALQLTAAAVLLAVPSARLGPSRADRAARRVRAWSAASAGPLSSGPPDGHERDVRTAARARSAGLPSRIRPRRWDRRWDWRRLGGTRMPPGCPVSVVLIGSAGAAGELAGRLPAGIAAGLAGATAAGAARRMLAARSALARRRDLRSALGMVAAELSAGATEATALRAAAAVGGYWSRRLTDAAIAAEAAGDVVAVLATRDPAHPAEPVALWPLAAAWHVRDACGASLAAVVHQVELDVGAAEDRHRTVEATLAGPRSSSVILCLLPAVGLLLGSAIGADPLRFLLGAGPGGLVLLAGVVADVAGLAVLRRLLATGGPP
ncbi:MAG: hypothetical protein ABJA87_00155 [bacterium]